METIYQSQFSTITWEAATQIITHTWLHNPDMTDEEYRHEHYYLVQAVKDYPVCYFISDSAASDFAISPDTQEWLSALVAKNFVGESKLLKSAIIPSPDFIGRLSSEQNVEEILKQRTSASNRIAYFENKEQAYIWIIGQSNVPTLNEQILDENGTLDTEAIG